MITYASKEMIPELKTLWKLCFHDEDAYIDLYYSNRFKEQETLVYQTENKIAAMLTLMPATVTHHNQESLVRYVYAVATHPDHRRLGYAAALIKYANEEKELGYLGTFLVPASLSLFSYYEALGYKTITSKKVLQTSVEDFLAMKQLHGERVDSISQLAEDEFEGFRDNSYKETGYLRWDQASLQYLLHEFRFLGGTAIKVRLEKESGAFLYYLDHNCLVVKETSLSDQGIYATIQYLQKNVSFTSVAITLTKTSQLEGESTPYVMSYGEGFEGEEYVNLVLD